MGIYYANKSIGVSGVNGSYSSKDETSSIFEVWYKKYSDGDWRANQLYASYNISNYPNAITLIFPATNTGFENFRVGSTISIIITPLTTPIIYGGTTPTVDTKTQHTLNYSFATLEEIEVFKNKKFFKHIITNQEAIRFIVNNGCRISFSTTKSNGSIRFAASTSRNANPPYLLDYELTIPIVSNVSVNTQAGFTVYWNATSQNSAGIELLKNGVLLKTYSVAGGTSAFNIPLSDITSAGTYDINVVAYNVVGEYGVGSGSFSVNPSITNLTVIGEYYEKPITINWRSEYQQGYEWEAYYNNVKVNGGTGTTVKEFVLPPNTFTGLLNASVRVRVYSGDGSERLYSNWAEKNISLKEIVPTIDNLSLSGSNIDLPLIFSWSGMDQQNFEAQIVKDDVVIKNYNGTTSQHVEIPPSTLSIGLHKFRVRVAYKDRWTPWIEITSALIETLPSIGAFEPDGVIVERDSNILVWWTSSNQSKWRLVIDESLTYNGTDTQALILSPATLQTGTHSMVLTVTYVTAAGVEKHTSKKAEFIVQGKPPTPTITSSASFASNRPQITWDTQEQQGYLLEILKGETIIYTTDWKNGLVTQHKILDYLNNGTYTVRIKIINQFGLESDYGSKSITVSGTEATNINLLVRTEATNTKLIWDNTVDKFRTFYVIRNGNVIAKVDGTEYTDYTCNHENTYVVRGINASEVLKDSNSVNVNVSIRAGLLATMDKLDDMMNVSISRNSNEFRGNIDISHSLVHLTGRELPVGVFGEHRSGTYNIRFSTKDSLFRFLDMCYKRQVFCYRDKRQTLYLTIPNPQYSIDKFGMEYTVQANEVHYDEVIAYD